MSYSLERTTKRFRLPRGWRPFWRWLGQLTLTVLLSSFGSAWLVRHWSWLRGRPEKPASTAKATEPVKRVVTAPKPTVAVGKTEALYRQHLEEIFRTLRGQPTVQMVKMDIPSSILSFQRSPASHDDGTTFHLTGTEKTIPVVAVSYRARSFLEQMFVTYIDPKHFNRKTMESIQTPFPRNKLKEFLLVPDLSGDNAARFVFEKK